MVKFYHTLRTMGVVGAFMAMASLPVMAQETPATLTIEVSDIKSTDATVSITPSDAEAGFFYDMKTKADYEEAGGAEKVVENQLAAWNRMAGMYQGATWQQFMEMNRKKAAEKFSAKEYIQQSLASETEYVVYAYSLDAEGNVTVPVTEKFFTTTAGIHSDNTFTVKLNTVVPGSRKGRFTANVTVTPANSDNYTVQCVTKATADQYDLSTPGSAEYKEFIRTELLYYLGFDETYSGEKTLDFEVRNEGTEYSIFVIGLDVDGAPSTDLTRLDFVAKQYPPELAHIDLEVSDITPMNAHVKVTPSDEEIYYFFDISRKSIVDEKGGLEAIPEKCIIDWWKFLEGVYGGGVKWTDFIPLQCRQGSLDAMMADLRETGEMSSLYWDTEWVVYAVGFNTDGEVITNVATQVFKTPKPESSDMTFEFEPVSMEKDEQATETYRQTMFQATIDIYPSKTDEEYKFNYMMTRFADQYENLDEDNFDFLVDQFLENSKTVKDAARVVMPQLQAKRAGAVADYYLIAVGWNEGPTTPLYKYKFHFDEESGVTVTQMHDAQVYVSGNTISMLGDCDGAAVYSTSGQILGTLRSGHSIDVPAGIYIVTYKANGKTTNKKVLVK